MMLPSRLAFGIGWLAVAGIMLSTGTLAAEGMSAGTTSEAAPDLVELALAYEHGEGVPTDQLKAAALYCEAARRGDAEAQYSLGWMYANGRGVARDDVVAASLLALAAEAGHAAARRALQFVGDERGPLPHCMLPDEPVVTVQEEAFDPLRSW